jgi:hypothetical protein
MYPNNASYTAGALQVENARDKKKYSLVPRKDAGENAYGLWVPAGEYVGWRMTSIKQLL